jgi:hypothetical protein
MPIRPEEKARYPKDWPAISRRIREREGQRCKWCQAPNGVTIKQPATWVTEHAFVEMLLACSSESSRLALANAYGKPLVVVLTVAHLDHTPENCADDNLVALCQRCHLTYDAKHHAASARATREKRSGQGRLFP